MHDNRRAHARFDTALSAEINTGDKILTAEAKNLSLGGVGLKLSAALEEGARVGLSLFLVEDGIEDETTSSLDIQAEVMWTAAVDTGVEAGLRFVDLPGHLAQLLQVYLGRLEAASGPGR